LNKHPSISERELEIINVIAKGAPFNQRSLSTQTGMSLGMTNLLLRRLVVKGYLKVRQLNRRKVEYLLTPRGFSEKAKKSYRYTLRTIDSLMLLKTNIQTILSQHLDKGFTHFILPGSGDIQDLVELASRQITDPRFRLERVPDIQHLKLIPGVMLISLVSSDVPHPVIPTLNILEALSGGSDKDPLDSSSIEERKLQNV
jgi:hypothetical protein